LPGGEKQQCGELGILASRAGYTAGRRSEDIRILKPTITRQFLRVTLTMIKSPLLSCALRDHF
jgi:hypothetical protein